MRWFVGGLVIGAVVAVLMIWQRTPSRECTGDTVVSFSDVAAGPPEGERDPATAAGWMLEDVSHVLSDPENPGEQDDRVAYFSYGGDRTLDEIVVVERTSERWFATRSTTCGR